MRFGESVFYGILANEITLYPNGAGDLPAHCADSLAFIRSIPEDGTGYAYAPGKWTVAEILGHLLDTRMVFLGRILYIARGETLPLPGFDEQLWVKTGGYSGVGRDALADMYDHGARLLQAMIGIMPAGALARQGSANGLIITSEEILLYLMAHEKHHLDVIAERYLKRG